MRLQSSNCSSAKHVEERLYLSLSSSSAPSVVSLSLCPVFRPLFYFFLLCSSRVALSGPVLPETPGTSPLSIFSTFPFRLLSLSLSPYFTSVCSTLHPTHLEETKKGSHLKSSAAFFVFALLKHLNLNHFCKFQKVIHRNDQLIIGGKEILAVNLVRMSPSAGYLYQK